MRYTIFLSAFILAVSAFDFIQPGFAQGCRFDGPELLCGTTGDRKSATYEFAAEETRILLANPLAELTRFPRPSDREKFRKSFERTWRATNRLEHKYKRQLRRGSMSDEDYIAWTKVYDNALQSYQSAFNFYRNVLWQSKD